MLEKVHLQECLAAYKNEGEASRYRPVSILSAIITIGNFDTTVKTMEILKESGFNRTAVYETILQSYLFLGFPRMIEAALAFNDVFGNIGNGDSIKAFSPDESQKWFDDGKKLCREVYGANYDKLEKKFLATSPEVFRWMVIEGYGKVLSRPGLTHIERELAEVAALMVDGRRRQLLSHLMGSLNMGASFDMIKIVLRDIRPLLNSSNNNMAVELIEELERKHASDL